MNLHEYQAKQIFREYGLPVPNGIVISSIEQITEALSQLQTEKVVAKAQIHAGGRGKAGGVKLLNKNKEEIENFVANLLHKQLVTYQTDERGQPVNKLLLEESSDIDRELYLSAVVDREQKRVVIMVSNEGGVEIEKVAKDTPEKILYIPLDPFIGIMPFQCRELAYGLGLSGAQIGQFSHILTQIATMFVHKDMSLLEVNPLVITKANNLICLDAKIVIDENALYRQTHIRDMHDASQEDPRELLAQQWGINYVALNGNIGCMVNGAGLAMATMDLIKLCGGEPANFLDVGGGATQERVTAAFKIILSDQHVKAVLVNIFGGIVRCDLIAAGIIAAINEVGIQVPVVVRLEGNNAQLASDMLRKSGLNLIAEQSMQAAAEQVVHAIGRN